MGYFYQYPRKRSILSAIILSIISAVIGGLLALSLAPQVYGPGFMNAGNQQGLPQQQAALPPGNLDYSPVVAIAERVGPTVVGISNQRSGQSIFERNLVESGSGSGVIISQDGYIVTNYHVIADADKIMVTLADKRQIEAKVAGSDPDTDLAVLQIAAGNLPVAMLGDSNILKVGELVVAIGNPLGADFARSVTAGVVSAKEREIVIEDRKFSLLQTDAAINPGNSGGALVNSQGSVIGINSVKLVISGVEGMGFAIPISDAKPIINELIEKGYISRPSLGIWGVVIDERLALENRLPQGIFIRRVVQGGAAEKAGLGPNDIIIGINETEIKTFEELTNTIKKFKPGDKITVSIYRQGKNLKLPLTLGEKGRE